MGALACQGARDKDARLRETGVGLWLVWDNQAQCLEGSTGLWGLRKNRIHGSR